MRRIARLSTFAMILPVLAWTLSGASPALAAAARDVTGFVVFYDGGTSAHVWMERPGEWDAVTFDAATIEPDGSLATEIPAAAASFVREHHLTAYVCVSNYGQTDFDARELGEIFASPRKTLALEHNLVRLVRGSPYAGINVDFELNPGADAGRFAAFLAALRRQLHAVGRRLTVDVPAKTPDDTWDGGYDLAAIGRAADQVIVMAYDYSGPGGPPGPVAPAPWVAAALSYTIARIPVANVVLGIPAYGYDWHASATDSLSLPEVGGLIRQFGVTPRWDAAAEVPYFTYTGKGGVGHTVYYEDSASLVAELEIAQRDGLRGISLWYVGSEDSGYDQVLRRYAEGLIP